MTKNKDTAHNINSLIDAAQSGNIKVIQELIEQKTNINGTDLDGKTALIYAAEKGYNNIVQELIANGANVNLSDTNNKTALFYAIEQGNQEIALAIMKADGSYNQERTLIHAIEKGCVNIVDELIEKNPDLVILEKDKKTPLIYAAEKGKIDIIKSLIAKKANVNAQDKDGMTALMYAIDNSEESLLFAMMRIQQNSKCNRYDMIAAIKRDYNEIVKILINQGANLNLQDNKGRTALRWACLSNEDIEIAKALIKKGADVNIANNIGETPLVIAAYYGHQDIVKLLLKQPGIDLTQLNAALDAAMEFEIRNNKQKTIEYLLRAGATLDETKHKNIKPIIKIMADKYNDELSDPDLKALRSVKEGKSKFDILNPKFDFAAKKEKFMSKINTTDTFYLNKDLYKNLDLDIDGLSDQQVSKLNKTFHKFKCNNENRELNYNAYNEKLAEELIIKVEMMKIKNSRNAAQSNETGFADAIHSQKTNQGKSR